MSLFAPLCNFFDGLCQTRLTPPRLSFPCQLLLLAIVAVAYWFTIPPRVTTIPVPQARYAIHRPATPFGHRGYLKVANPPYDDDEEVAVAASSYDDDDSVIAALTPAFQTLNLGPGLRKRTSKKRKKVRFAEESNTLRWATKWIGFEDDEAAEHFTEDVVWTSDGCGRSRRSRRRVDEVVIVRAVHVVEERSERLDDDGDVAMEDVDDDGGGDPGVSLI